MCATNKFLQQAPENVDMLWTTTHKRWYTHVVSLSLSPPRLEKGRERDDKSKKATPHIWEELRTSARSRNSTPTHHIHRLGRKGFLYFLLLFSFRAMSYTTRRVVSITWAAPKQNAAASKCHTLKAN